MGPLRFLSTDGSRSRPILDAVHFLPFPTVLYFSYRVLIFTNASLVLWDYGAVITWYLCVPFHGPTCVTPGSMSGYVWMTCHSYGCVG